MKMVLPQDNASIELRWMKPAEAAIYARVTLSKIRQWIAEGALPVAMTRNKQHLHGKGASGYILDRNDIDKLLEKLKIRVKNSASPRASGQTGPQHGDGRGASKSAPRPAPNGPYVKQGRSKTPRPGEPA